MALSPRMFGCKAGEIVPKRRRPKENNPDIVAPGSSVQGRDITAYL